MQNKAFAVQSIQEAPENRAQGRQFSGQFQSPASHLRIRAVCDGTLLLLIRRPA